MKTVYNLVAGVKEISQINAFVTETAVELGCDPEAVDDLVVAVHEAIANIVVHGYQKQAGFIEIEFERKEDDLYIFLRDEAPHYDPTTHPIPNVSAPLEQREVGGMGVHMMRNFADEMQYKVNALGQNELLFVKQDAFLPVQIDESFNSGELHSFGLFRDVSAHRYYQEGDVIFKHGDIGEAMYIVMSGSVEVQLEGRRIDYLQPGNVLGEMALLDDRVRSATAVAHTDCILNYIDRPKFNQLTQQHPQFAIEIMQIMSHRVRKLLKEEIRRQRMEEELAIGQQIQLSLLPKNLPSIPGWEFAARYRAARQVGGDLYDFITDPTHPHKLQLVIADVTGKGVPAALFMAMARTFVRAETSHSHAPATILRQTNRLLVDDARSRLFLTIFYGSLDVTNGRFVYANGGHDWPIWYQSQSQTIQYLQAPGFPLGTFTHIHPIEQEINIASGDFLLLYTDGITEARNQDGEFFSDERLESLVANSQATTAQQLLEEIDTAVAQFLSDTPASDDFTLVVIKRQ